MDGISERLKQKLERVFHEARDVAIETVLAGWGRKTPLHFSQIEEAAHRFASHWSCHIQEWAARDRLPFQHGRGKPIRHRCGCLRKGNALLCRCDCLRALRRDSTNGQDKLSSVPVQTNPADPDRQAVRKSTEKAWPKRRD